jgi:hypothetical protein
MTDVRRSPTRTTSELSQIREAAYHMRRFTHRRQMNLSLHLKDRGGGGLQLLLPGYI